MKKRYIIIIFLIAIFTFSTGYAFYSQNLSVKGTAKIVDRENSFCDIKKFDGYSEFVTTAKYEIYDSTEKHNVHAIISVTNVGNKYISFWRSFIRLPYGAKITNSYNTTQVFTGDISIFDSPSKQYNNIILAGDTISFDIQYEAPSSNYEIEEIFTYGWDTRYETEPSINKMASCLEGIEIEDPEEEIEDEILLAEITSVNYYNNDTEGNIVVSLTNKSDKDISNWYFILDVGNSGSVSGCWAATCSQTNNEVYITAPSWSLTLQPNQKADLQFQVRVESGFKAYIKEAGRIK